MIAEGTEVGEAALEIVALVIVGIGCQDARGNDT